MDSRRKKAPPLKTGEGMVARKASRRQGLERN
jgi:hypothetical protein